MGRLVRMVAALALAAASLGCNTRGQASIPEDLSAEEERAQEEELKAIRAEESKTPRPVESDKDEP